MSKRCRICLCLKPRRGITELEITKGSTKPSYAEIISFCLNITVDEDSELGTKLCVKCHRKILDFYGFKTMAQMNNTVRSDIVENMQNPEDVEIKYEGVNLPRNDELLSKETFNNIKREEITETYEHYDNGIQLEDSTDEDIEHKEQSVEEDSIVENIKEERENVPKNPDNETYEQFHNDVQNEDSTDEVAIEHKAQSDEDDSLIENIKEDRENVPKSTDIALLQPMAVLPKQKKKKTKDTSERCPECGKSVRYLKDHLNTHLSPDEKQNLRNKSKSKRRSSVFCKECGKIVNRLQEHMAMHLPENIWQKPKKGAGLSGTCKVCGKTVKRLKKHMVMHLPEFQHKKEKSTVKGKKKSSVKCLMCSREFVSQQYLDMHMKNLHLRPKKQCPICNKKVNKVKMHMLTAHNRDQLQYECDICGMRHATRYILEKHIAIHTNDRPFECQQCDKAFIQKSALKKHQQQVHLNIRPYLCQFCSSTFCTNAALDVHVRGLHTKERPFKCSDCDKGFNTKNMLKSHIEHVHTHVKNYGCTLCPKRYKTKVEVTRHNKEVHLKIKNYQCRFCESRFYRASHMKRHEYTIHKRYAQGETDE